MIRERPTEPEARPSDRIQPSRSEFDPGIESMSRADLEALQLRKLAVQLERAWQTEFYRQRFADAGISPGDVRSLDDLRGLPVTRKEDICRDVEELPPYGSRLTVPASEVVCAVETSGTSGKGKEVHVATREDLDRIIEMEATGFVWAGIGTGTVVLLTMPITMTAASTWWTVTLHELGANFLRTGHLSTEEKLRYMVRYGVEVLIATPTYLSRLEHTAARSGLSPRDIESLRRIIVVGEARSADWAMQREAVWGAAVSEQWGCTQGAVAWSCEQGMASDGKLGLLHGLPHLAVMEVVDPETGTHVSDGESGELIITPLGVTGAPLIRFATGDKVVLRRAEHCPCGRAFDGIQAGSISRYDDMLKVKGVNVWPSAVSDLIDRDPQVTEYRVTAAMSSEGHERLTVDVEFQHETSPSHRAGTIDQLQRDLRAVTGLNLDVTEWTGPGSLSDEVLGGVPWKAKRWRDLRGAT